ncbi:MAG: Hsp20/alpha crystallin family protein, partial [Cyclobacteriaceae bacterium]
INDNNNNNFLGGFNGISAMENFPTIDKKDLNPFTGLSENEHRIKLELGLPKFSKKDLRVTIDHKTVSVYGSKLKVTDNGHTDKSNVERLKFKRIFQVPPSIKSEDIRVSHNERILSLIMPKRNNAAKSTIAVS